MKSSPCCHEPIVKRKRYGGQITLDYCKKCNRRVWGGQKMVTRETAYQISGEIMKKIARKKPQRQEKFMDIFVARLTERYDKE